MTRVLVGFFLMSSLLLLVYPGMSDIVLFSVPPAMFKFSKHLNYVTETPTQTTNHQPSEVTVEKYLLKNFQGSVKCEPPQDDTDLPRHEVDQSIFR